MTDAQIKKLAAQKLAKHGINASEDEGFATLVEMIETATGMRRKYDIARVDFVRAFAAPAKPTRHAFPFRPLRARRHLRQDEIDALPRPISMGLAGPGLYAQRAGRHFWRGT